MAHCNTSSNNTQSITSSSHTSSINLPSNNKGVTFRAMPTPFFSVTNLYHALPSLPHCSTFKHLNYNLTTYTPHLHFTPYYTRCTYSYLTPYTPFLYDILYSFNIHTLIHTTQLLTAPLAGPINMIKLNTPLNILLQAHHPHCTTHRYFKAWCAPSQLSNIIILISLYCNLKIHAGTLAHCIHHLCSILYNTYATAHLYSWGLDGR